MVTERVARYDGAMKALLAVLLLSIGVASAQSMVEYGVLSGASATAGASAKGVGAGLGKIFGTVNQQTAAAAKQGAAEKKTAPTVAGAMTTPAASPAPSAATTAPPLPAASRDALAKVTAGMTRKDLVAKAGEPASKIMMDEDGHLVELYTYAAKGESIASVRLMDGAVE